MKIIIAADSRFLSSRLYSIFSAITHIEIAGTTDTIYDAAALIKSCCPSVLIIALHQYSPGVLEELKKIKDQNKELLTIVLSDNTSSIYIDRWRNFGADYVFDQAFQLYKIVDVLCDILYKELIKTI